uniref:Uncharacterized protein n=1 Tax=Romanomermis culicivorax TaxID=13658 RepID=A0A915I627_ROMCU
MKIEKECVDTLLTSLDKKQLLQLAELNRIFDVLGNEAEVPRAQAHEMVDDMVKDNVLTPEEAIAVKKQLTADKIKLAQIAKLTEPYVMLRGDGTVGSKNAPAKATTPSTTK